MPATNSSCSTRDGARPLVNLVTDNFPPTGGGVSRYYAGLREAYGPDMRVVSPTLAEVPGRRPLVGRSEPLGLVRQAVAATEWRRREGRPVELMGHPHLAMAGVVARRRTGLFIHGGEWADHPGGPVAVQWLVRRCCPVIVNSQATLDTWLPEQADRAFVLRPALAPSWLSASDGGSERRPRPGPLALLSVSRLVPRKGLEETLATVMRMLDAGVDVTYTIVGAGPLLHRLRQMARGRPQIVVRGEVDDDGLRAAYRAADVFVLCPSHRPGGDGFEGFGIVYLEAASFGLVVVASRSGGVGEAVAPGASHLIRPGDWAGLQAHLAFLASHPEVARSGAAAARSWAMENSWTRRAHDLAEHLARL